jgi:hypothetical protein
MFRLSRSLLLLLAALVALSAQADARRRVRAQDMPTLSVLAEDRSPAVRNRNRTMANCMPVTYDGSQVTVYADPTGRCDGVVKKVLVYKADYAPGSEAICYGLGLFCTPLALMSEKERNLYLSLEQYRALGTDHHTHAWTQSGTTWEIDVVCKDTTFCTIDDHAARYRDQLTGLVCIRDGKWSLGCFTPRPFSEAAVQQR